MTSSSDTRLVPSSSAARPATTGRAVGDGPVTPYRSTSPVASPAAPRGRSEPVLTWGALVVTTAAGLLLLGATSAPTSDLATAGPTVLSFVAPASGTASVLVRVVGFVATAVVAGLGLTRALVGLRPSGRSSLQVARVAGVAAGLAALAGGLLGDTAWPWALIHLALVVAVVALLPYGRSAGAVGPVAVVLTTVLAAATAAGRHGPALPLELIGSVGTTVALGIAIAGATGATGAPGAGVTGAGSSVGAGGEGRYNRVARRRTAVTGVAAGLAAGVAGLAMIAVEGPWTTHDLVTGPAGLAALARTVLPLPAVAALAPGLWAPAPAPAGNVREHRRREWARWSAISLVGAVAAAAVLGALPSSPDAPRPGQALLRPVQLGLDSMALLVAPTGGGPTLMRLSPAAGGGQGGAAAHVDHRRAEAPPVGYSVRAAGADAPSVSFTPRPGAPGVWALVDLPAGTDAVSLTGPGGTATVPVATAPLGPGLAATLAGPDGPECTDRFLGDLLARGHGAGGAPVACPAAALEPTDARSLELAVGDLARRGLRTLHLVGDASPRARQATAVVRAAAQRSGLAISTTPRPDDGLLVLSGWASAHATLTDVTARATLTPTFTGGQFLAPWLVTRGVLAAGSSTMFPLGFVPQEPTPRGYAAMLTTVFADAAPSAVGYLAWGRAQGLPEGGTRLYGAAAMDVMPGMPGMNHGDLAGAWLPGGSVIPISDVLS